MVDTIKNSPELQSEAIGVGLTLLALLLNLIHPITPMAVIVAGLALGFITAALGH